ncbi:hypothetical protein GGI43DRAFT_279528 [Trichoderma evansii]
MAQTLKRKRRRADESPPDHSSKSSKSSGTVRRLSNFSPEFYDSLSKIWLTPRALRELDRRNENLPPYKSTTTPAAGLVKPRGAKLVALAKLGRSELARFAATGGPDLSDLTGYPEPSNITHSMASTLLPLNHDGASLLSSSTRQTRRTRRRTATSKSRRTSAYDDNFMQYLIQYCIYPPRYKLSNGRRSPKPNNFEEIRQILKESRRSLSPSVVLETAHEDFLEKIAVASEADLARKVVPLISGDADIPNSSERLFTNLASITGDTTARLQPDFFDGADPEDVNINVREDLNNTIIPTKKTGAPIAPNFFLELKSEEGKWKVARAQSILNGAHGAYIMHALQNYLVDEEPVYDGNAYAFTATLVRGHQLDLYAHHLTAPTQPGERHGCHTTLLRAYALNDEENYSTGRAAFRNLRMRAKEDRDRFIETANERARRQNEGTDDGSMERGDGVEESFTTSFTSADREDYQQPRRQLRPRNPRPSSSSNRQNQGGPPPSSSTRNKARNPPPSSSTQKRARSSPTPSTRQRKRRARPAG